jgi:hypothetical protein
MSDQYAPRWPALHPHPPAIRSARTATAIAVREFVRSRTAPAGRLATTALPNMTPTMRPAVVDPIPIDSRMTGVTLAGAIS